MAQIVELHSLGLSGGRARRLLQLPQYKFSAYAKAAGVKLPYDMSGRRPPRRIDPSAVVALRKAGASFHEIGSRFGVSRQRAHQIFTAARDAVEQTGEAA